MKKLYTFILWGVLLCFATPAMSQLSELSGKVINSIGSEASSFSTNQWYLMYNRGRGTYAYERSNGMVYVKNSDIPVAGDDATTKSAFLIRLVDSGTTGKYYIQTGNGNYFGSLTEGDNNGVTSNKSVLYSCNTINGNSGHFYFNDGNNMIMDANGPGDCSLAGWGYGSVTSTNGNNDWALYPITLGINTNLSGAELLEHQLENHSLFRIKNRNAYSTGWSNPMLSENDNNNLSIKNKTSDTDLSQIWIIEQSGNGYTLRNANSGRYINDLATGSTSTSSTEPKIYFIKYGDNNSSTS
ncbi:MAG: hypothetical protein IJ269_01775, partial [Bacteroidales bacterium]|nr:hypothetical protein [Bacteroidales bacterium]